MMVLFIGTAGCGKTTLTSSFGRWLEERGFKVSYVNLDPGVEFLPYTPTFDVRSMVTTAKLMRDMKLGPNGAMIMAAEIMEKNIDLIAKNITSSCNSDFTLIDTPGQMELFVFRGLGPALTSTVKTGERVVAVYIVDAETVTSVVEYLIIKMLSLIIELRLDVPTITVINKGDIVDSSKFMIDVDAIKRELESREEMLTDVAFDIVDVLWRYEKPARMVTISALRGEGMEKLYDLMVETFCVCGDLT